MFYTQIPVFIGFTAVAEVLNFNKAHLALTSSRSPNIKLNFWPQPTQVHNAQDYTIFFRSKLTLVRLKKNFGVKKSLFDLITLKSAEIFI